MNLNDIPPDCLAVAKRSIDTLPDGREISLSCEGRHFRIRRIAADYKVEETPQIQIAAAAKGSGAKPCSGCGNQTDQPPAPPVGEVNLREYFDLVFVLNLPRRKDRLDQFREHIAQIAWPFREPEVFTAIDAKACPPPPWWPTGAGSWGCMESHRHMLARSLSLGAKRVLILEDDFFGIESFASLAAQFVKSAPENWEMLYFGGQDVGRDGSRFRKEISPGVFQVAGIERTHAYAVQGEMIRDLYQKLIISSGHCDHVIGPLQKGRKVYATAEWLAGQRESKSDIGKETRSRLWQTPKPDAPVFLLNGDRTQADALRKLGYHFGYQRNESGIDLGLAKIAQEQSPAEAVKRLRKWIDMLLWEARSMTPEQQVCIWCPELKREIIHEAAGARLVEL